MKKISCIIPAYNEGPRVEEVLRAVSGHPLLEEVIVVDDGSTDDTSARIFKFPNVRYIRQQKNAGKCQTIYTGLKEAKHDIICLIDADLAGIVAEDVTRLLRPVVEERADVSLSLRKNAPLVWRLIGLDYISGERVFPKALIASSMEAIASLPRFGLEVFLNDLILRQHQKIAVVAWHAVKSPFKIKKRGLSPGLLADMHMMRDIFKTISPLRACIQIISMHARRTLYIEPLINERAAYESVR